MRTYLTVTFNSDGAKPSDVNDALMGIGFRPTKGPHDWSYEWPGSASIDEVLEFGDRIHTALEGMGVMFQMETV